MSFSHNANRYALVLATVTSLLLIWLSLGVGIIGKDGDRANAMYFGVLAIEVFGALITRLKPKGMARVLIATAGAQTVVTLIAVLAGLGRPWSGPVELLLLNAIFIALWLASAWLFERHYRRLMQRKE